MMVALLLYCYAPGTRSSRPIMRRCQVEVACRVIVGAGIPGFRTISDFRKAPPDRLEAPFAEVLTLCATAGLAKVGAIALDGTKAEADASRHKAVSYDRMQQGEGRLQQEIATRLAEARAADESEDLRHGPDRHGDELPGELTRRQSRLAKIRQAKAQLEGRAKLEATAEAARRQAEASPRPPSRRPMRCPPRRPRSISPTPSHGS